MHASSGPKRVKQTDNQFLKCIYSIDTQNHSSDSNSAFSNRVATISNTCDLVVFIDIISPLSLYMDASNFRLRFAGFEGPYIGFYSPIMMILRAIAKTPKEPQIPRPL